MSRLRTFIALVAFGMLLAIGPIAMAQDAPPGNEPPVVVDGGTVLPAESAWTFRFLVPTVLAISAIAVVGTMLRYGTRVRGRYRVVR